VKLPRELEKLRPWLEEQRPYKDVSLEEALEADTSVFINPARSLTENGFQDAVSMLAAAIREGHVKVARKRRVREALREVYDPPARWSGPFVET
jgi:hypothetical protein